MKGYLLVILVFTLGWWVGATVERRRYPESVSELRFQVTLPELRSVGSVQSVIERSR